LFKKFLFEMSIFILIVLLISTDGLILNETAFNPPEVTVYEHMMASFGLQPEDSIEYSFFPLVLVKPDHGCGDVENWEELQGAIALTLHGTCSYFDKAWNIASYGGRGIVVGNDIENEDTLVWMTKSPGENREVDIPCVFVSKATYDAASAAIEGDRGGTVFASLAEGNSVVSYFPDTIKIVTYLVVVFPSLWVILTIIHCCHRNFRARRERQQRARQHKKIPEVLFTKGLLTSLPQNGSNVWVSRNKTSIINDSCAICLEDFQERTKLKLLACGHGYHSKCIAPWIAERSDTCPVCRKTVTDNFESDVHVSCCCFRANSFNGRSGITDVEML